MSFADEDSASDHALNWTQECQCSFIEVESGDIAGQSEIIQAKGLAETDLAELAVDRVGVEKRQTTGGNRNGDLLFGHGEGELQLQRCFQFDGSDQGLETIARYSQRISAWT